MCPVLRPPRLSCRLPPEDPRARPLDLSPMMEESRQESVSRLLEEVREGDRVSFDALYELVYDELHEVAHGQRLRWQGLETLNTTALVHEAYVKLAEGAEPTWQNRAHFLAVAARAMRQVLIDYAKARQAAKRGGERQRVPFEEAKMAPEVTSGFSDESVERILLLDRSLGELERRSDRQCRIVECRFFGGMTIRETAEALGISPATVKRGWTMAQAWLYREMRE